MTLDNQFLDFMPYTVVVQNPSGFADAYGGRSFATTSGFNWQCRIEQEGRLFKAKDGREVRSSATLFGPPYDATTGKTSISFQETAKVTLPSGIMIAGSSQPPVLAVFQEADESGTMYWEILL